MHQATRAVLSSRNQASLRSSEHCRGAKVLVMVQPMNTSTHMKNQNENDRKEIKFNNLKGKMLLFGLIEEAFFL